MNPGKIVARHCETKSYTGFEIWWNSFLLHFSDGTEGTFAERALLEAWSNQCSRGHRGDFGAHASVTDTACPSISATKRILHALQMLSHLLDHQDHHYDTMTNMLWKSINIKTCFDFYWCGYFAAMNSLRRNCWAWATGFSFASLFDIQGEKNPNHRLRGSEWPRCLPCHTMLALWQLVGGYTYTTKIYKNALLNVLWFKRCY